MRDGDEEIIAAPIDLLGINYYTPAYVAARPGRAGGDGAYPGTEGVEFLPPVGPTHRHGLADRAGRPDRRCWSGCTATTRACR